MTINKQSLLYSFWAFIRHPKYEPAALKKSILSKSWDIFRLTGFFLMLSVIIGYLSSLILQSFNYDLTKNEILNLFAQKNILLVIFLALIWAPISEELSFRLILKYSPFRFSFSVGFLLVLFYQIILSLFPAVTAALPPWLADPTVWQALAHYVLFVGASGFGFGYLLKKSTDSKFIEKLYSKNFPWLFYALTTFFAFLHFFNYTDIKQIWFLAPIIVLPQFILSLNLGFIRVNYGLRWSILTHFGHNFMSAFPSIILMAASANIFEFVITKDEQLLSRLSLGDMVIMALSSLMMIAFGLVAIIASLFLLLDLCKKK